jgi:hypothetical protein
VTVLESLLHSLKKLSTLTEVELDASETQVPEK